MKKVFFKKTSVTAAVLIISMLLSFGIAHGALASPGKEAKPDVALKLSGGPDYAFVADAWNPQLTIAAESAAVTDGHKYLKMDIKCADVEKLSSVFSAGSRSSLGGGEFTYAADKDLGIYFDGTDVTGIGVTQDRLFNAFNSQKELLKAGKTASLILPIAGSFKSTSAVTALKIMVTHGDAGAVAVRDLPISIENVRFSEKDTEEEKPDPVDNDGVFTLTNGEKYGFIPDEWNPQLSVAVSPEKVNTVKYQYLTMKLSCKDIEKLLASVTNSSRSNITDGGWTDGPSPDGQKMPLKIYFGGTDVSKIGVAIGDFGSVFEKGKEKLKAGDTVTLSFKLSNNSLFTDTSVITSVEFMPTHSAGAKDIAGIEMNIFEMKLTEGDMTDLGNEDDKPVNNDTDGVFVIKGNGKHAFSGEEWWPQLSVEVEPEKTTSKNNKYITMTFSCTGIAKIIESISMSSRSNITDGGWTDGPATDGSKMPLKIYFTGTDVSRIGVDLNEFKNVLLTKQEELERGKAVTMTFKLSNPELFSATSVINKIEFMPTHSAGAAAINGIQITFYDIKLTDTAPADGGSSEEKTDGKWEPNVIFSGNEGKWTAKGKASAELGERRIVSLLSWNEPGCSVQVLNEGGNTYIKTVSSTHEWNPDWWIETSSKEYDLKKVGYIRLDIKLQNPDAILNAPFFSDDSPANAPDYSPDAYAVYFSNGGQRNGLGFGVKQSVFRAALSHFKKDLEAGKWVTVDLPIDDPEMLAKAEFSSIVFKYGKGVTEEVTVCYDNIRFMNGKADASYTVVTKSDEPKDEDNAVINKSNKAFTASDLTSTHNNIVVDFASKKIYVAEGTIIRDLYTYLTLSEGFTKHITYQGANMANRQKKITGSDFDFVVTDGAGNQTVFRLVPCKLDKDGKLIIPTAATENSTGGGQKKGGSFDWQLLVTVLASVIFGCAASILAQLIYNKKFVLFGKRKKLKGQV